MSLERRENYLAQGFQAVDRSDVDKLRTCLDCLQSQPAFKVYKDRTIELLGLESSSAALGIACGLGDDVARLKGQCRRAVGVDLSERLLAEARTRQGETGCEFLVADATSLPFSDGEFDAVRVDRALMHVASPAAVVAEMARLTRRGGVVLAAEPDWGTFLLGTPYSQATERIQRHWAGSFRHPWIGRNLVALLATAGLVEVQTEVHWLGTREFALTAQVFDLKTTIDRLTRAGEDLAGWLEAYRNGQALAGVALFVCWGRKP